MEAELQACKPAVSKNHIHISSLPLQFLAYRNAIKCAIQPSIALLSERNPSHCLVFSQDLQLRLDDCDVLGAGIRPELFGVCFCC